MCNVAAGPPDPVGRSAGRRRRRAHWGIDPAPSPRPLDQPAPSRLAPDHPRRAEILAAHRAALAAGEPGYPDPVTGLLVLTAARLLANGECCGSGCRHCPWQR